MTLGEKPTLAAKPDINEAISPFVNGQYIPSQSTTWVDVINPANNTHLCRIPSGNAEDVDIAVAVAKQNFLQGHWHLQAPSQKKAVLLCFAELISSHADTLDALDALEMGKPLSLGRFNAAAAAAHMQFKAEAIDKLESTVLASDDRTLVLQQMMPRGVVAAITPWNFPTFNAVLKIAPALATGNSVILKPSEMSSQSAFKLAELALEAGLPPGTLSVLPGLGSTVGEALALHMDVSMITFTGSSQVGKLMLQYSGQSNMKEVVAECGGKSPQIVCNDGVDLDDVADGVAGSILTNQGQVCSTGSRLLVHKSLQEPLIRKIITRMEGITIGDPLKTTNSFGPLVSEKQIKRVEHFIRTAEEEGADLVYGGERVLTNTGGNYIQPTVFINVDPYDTIAQQEVFGPVLSVIPFETEAEAIKIANATCYGLVCYLWSNNTTTAMNMAKKIPSGAIFINADLPVGEGPGSAFTVEPYGDSGIGVEGGLAGMQTFMRRQLLWLNH